MQNYSSIFKANLIERYNSTAPRYTSYPTALEMTESFTEQELIEAFRKYPKKVLSIYVHIPFCHQLCYFCACNKVITSHQDRADIYLDFLEQEISTKASYLAARKVTQIHLGGGSPSFLDKQQMSYLMTILKKNFDIDSEAEISIEIDPRGVTSSYLQMLRELGFNRLSMGVQDFNSEVQEGINRVQDKEAIFALVAEARTLDFHSISIDLIYGLPKQTLASFSKTIEKVIELSPDRISVYNFAYLPKLIKAHRLLPKENIPDATLKLQMYIESINLLTNAGYQFIGMDHFAKANDNLAIAQNKGQLHRNFQGYTTEGDADLVGFGVSSISMIGDAYAQNEKIIPQYYQVLSNGKSALKKGIKLTAEDCLRRDIIKQIICNFQLTFAEFEKLYQINFKEKFSEELKALAKMQDDGILVLSNSGLEITPVGRLLIRHVAMVFDSYSEAKKQSFSAAI